VIKIKRMGRQMSFSVVGVRPRAGEPLALHVGHESLQPGSGRRSLSVKPLVVRVHIGSQLLFEHRCPDPPCHETLLVPEGTADRKLKVSVTDERGAQWLQRFVVRTPRSGGRS